MPLAPAERIIRAERTNLDSAMLWRLVLRLAFQNRTFEFHLLPSSELAAWRAVADWTQGATVAAGFPGGKGVLSVKGDYAYFRVKVIGGQRSYPISRGDLSGTLHGALNDAEARGWLFGRELYQAYMLWRGEPCDEEEQARVSDAIKKAAADWKLDHTLVFRRALAGLP